MARFLSLVSVSGAVKRAQEAISDAAERKRTRAFTIATLSAKPGGAGVIGRAVKTAEIDPGAGCASDD